MAHSAIIALPGATGSAPLVASPVNVFVLGRFPHVEEDEGAGGGADGDDGGMRRFRGVVRLEAATGQVTGGGMDRILVRDHDEIAAGDLCGVFPDAACGAQGELGEGFVDERELVRVLEVRLELSRPLGRQLLPGDPGPALRHRPFGESLVLDERPPGRRLRDHPSGLDAALQRRGDDAGDGCASKPGGCGRRLVPTAFAQAEAGEVGVDEMVGVVHLAVPDEVDALRGHGDQSSGMDAGPGRTSHFAERFLHVDMDAFYVEVERLRDPSLRGVPVVVGGLGPRGVVSSASYEARASGVHSAMPIAEARRRCPRARFVPPDHRAYAASSGEVFALLEEFTPAVERISVDEAFLDIAGLRLHFGSPAEVAVEIRAQLREHPGLPASVGAATTKFLAKLASEEAKPDGFLVVAAGRELEFLHPLPVRRLWGVGAATHAALEALAVETIGDLAALPPATLEHRLGPSVGRHLAALARGEDPRAVEVESAAKSISVEETFGTDLVGEEAIEDAMLALCARLSGRLGRVGRVGRTVTVKLRSADFTTTTRSLTRRSPVAHTPQLWDAARTLLARMPVAGGVRLLGVGVSHLETARAPRQLSMTEDGRTRVADAADRVRKRYGEDAVVPARLVAKHARRRGKPPDR